MTPETRMLVKYRLDRAREALAEASLLLDSGHANTGVNRLYYACFYAVSALLLTKGLTATSLSGLRTLFHEFFHMPIAQGIRDIPPDPHQNDVLGKMGPLETDRHGRAPSCITVAHGGQSYRKSPQMKIATKPATARRFLP